MLGTNNEYGGLEKRIVTGNVCVIANLFFIKYKISVCFLGIACVFYKNKIIKPIFFKTINKCFLLKS